MLVLCYGIPKSGSTLAFELVKGMLVDSGFEQEVLWNDRRDPAQMQPGRARNFIEGITCQKISHIVEAIGPARKIAVKTHSGFPDELFGHLEDLQQRHELQVVASYRDPRDICLSLVDQARKARLKGKPAFSAIAGLDQAAANIRRRIREFRKWASLKGSLRLGYDTVAFSPDEAIDVLEKTLGVACNRVEVKRYAYEQAYTLKNKAQRDRHKEELSDEEGRQLAEIFREFLERVLRADDQRWFDEYRQRMLAAQDV
jgi:hypothetical protein